MYEYISTPIKYIYGLVQAEHFWFKEYIKTMTLKAWVKKFKTDPCLLYRVNEIGPVIIIVYVDDTLETGDKPAFMNTIECIKKEYANHECFIGCMIKSDLTKMTLNISQPDIITNMTQGFKKDVKSMMTFNTAATPHKGILRNQETGIKIS